MVVYVYQVVLEEARESYEPEMVHEVSSVTVEDMEANVQRVKQWLQQWIIDHPGGSLPKNCST